jgi:hypothetical protein
MIVADQNHIGGTYGALNLLGVEKRIIGAKSLVELAKIFAAAVRILGAYFALHSRQRVQLHCAAAGSKIRCRCHDQINGQILILTSGSSTPYAPMFEAIAILAGAFCPTIHQ